MKKVTVGLVLFGDKYLEQSIPTLLNQDYPNVEYIFRDQEEGKFSAFQFLKEKMPWVFEKVNIEKSSNLWHSGGHNTIMKQSNGDYYLCASYDMLYPPDMISKMVKAFEEDEKIGFVGARLMRWDFDKNSLSDRIDSLGISITKAHRFLEIKQGKKYREPLKKEVFGISAALCMYRMDALKIVEINNQFFDEFLHYKNDVDLSYRLRLAGIEPRVLNDLVVFHDRQVNEIKRKPLWVIKSSTRGDFTVLLKNWSHKLPLIIKLKTLAYHAMKTVALGLVHPSIIDEIKTVMKHIPKIKKQAAAIQKNKTESQNLLRLMKIKYH